MRDVAKNPTLFDDRPQLAVDHLAPSQQGVAKNVDRGLGVMEISTLHARDLFREAVASDDRWTSTWPSFTSLRG